MGYLVKSASPARAIAAALKPVMKNLQKANVSPHVRRMLRKEILANPQLQSLMQLKGVPANMLNQNAIREAVNSALPGFGMTSKPLLGWPAKLAIGTGALGTAGLVGAAWGADQSAYIPKALKDSDAALLNEYKNNTYTFGLKD